MARRRLVRFPWALALITGIHQAEGVAGPARRTLPPSTGSGGTPIVPGGTPIPPHPPLDYTTLFCASGVVLPSTLRFCQMFRFA